MVNQVLSLQNEMDVKSKIIHERKLALIFNYAYEVIGQGIVSDAIYEYGLSTLKEYKKNYLTEWNNCCFFKEYFVDADDWEYTGSSVPLTEETRSLYEFFISNGNTLWVRNR